MPSERLFKPEIDISLESVSNPELLKGLLKSSDRQ
jgi:hypothetical protein